MPTSDDTLDWPAAARALRERLGEAFEPGVQAHLEAAVSPRILVACSGGADSVALLCLLWAWSEDSGARLGVAHYNHRWRGAESDEDAAFVSGVADALGCPFVMGERPEGEAAFTETAARELRLAFLRERAAGEGCDYIALGHQQDDILETQLQRLARGAGAEGMAAPRPLHHFDGLPSHLRPLLHLRAGDIRMALNACGIPWREDRTNEDTRITRNALRRQVIPALAEATGRNASEGAARSRKLFDEDAAALDLLARERLPEAYAGAPRLRRDPLRQAPVALVRRAVSHWLHNDRGIQTISAPLLDELLEAVRSGRRRHRFSTAGRFIRMDASAVWLEPADHGAAGEALVPVSLRPGESVLLSTGAQMDAEWVDLDEAELESILSGAVDNETEAFLAVDEPAVLQLRPRRPGDRFQPLGAPGRRKLKDCMSEGGVPVVERSRLPVVGMNDRIILWVPGLPPAESHKLVPGLKRALRLTYRTGKSL